MNHPDDFVILTVDVANSPLAELRLTEIYNLETSTLNDDYLLVLKDYVTQQLEDTHGLDFRSRCGLLDARFCTLHRRGNGDLLSLRKPATERLIRQTIQGRMDVNHPVSVSILIQFKAPLLSISRRLSTHNPPKICVTERTCDVGTTVATFRSRGVDILHEPDTSNIAFVDKSQLISTCAVMNELDMSYSGLPVSMLRDNWNDAFAFMNTTDGVNNVVASIIAPNLLEDLTHAIDSFAPGDLEDLTYAIDSFAPGDFLLVVKDIDVNDPYVIISTTHRGGISPTTGISIVLLVVFVIRGVPRSYPLPLTNVAFTQELDHGVLMLYRPIDRGRTTPMLR